jgi:hypothetical protein
MVKFQYISDIHLEFLKKIPNIKKLANNICLLGDIGYPNTTLYHRFIMQCSTNYKNVFLIYGNHENYTKLVKKPIYKNCTTMNQLENLVYPSNVYLLNNKTLFIDSEDNVYKDNVKSDLIKIIGSTLWSDINLNVAHYLNDYNYIYTENGLLTPNESIELFKKSKEYILDELNKDHIKTLLLTHHGTNNICNGTEYADSKIKSAFTTHITELLDFKHLHTCINGHIHVSINEKINHIQFLANCYGYPKENKTIVKYNENAVLEIE